MLAHVSLTHLADPEFALVGAGLFLLYLLWRSVSSGQLRAVLTPSLERDR